MTFQRFGRSYHLKIGSAEDLARAAELSEPHWVATGAPIESMNCDATFLRLVDTDANGRIMCFEVKRAIRWLFAVLRDTSGVAAGSTTLELGAIDTDDADGRRIRESASKMLGRLGLDETGRITLEQVRSLLATVQAAPVSEAGVVLPEASGDPQVRQFLADIIATVGGAPHPSGREGVDRSELDEFVSKSAAYLDWRARGELPEGRSESDVMPLGDRTHEAFAVYSKLRERVDQYFAQCEAVGFDPRVAARLGAGEAELQSLDLSDPQAIEAFIRRSPLARPRADQVLSFDQPMNPAWAEQVARLRAEVLEPVLGATAPELSAEQWGRVKGFFAAHEEWVGAKAGGAVEPLGVEKLREYQAPRFRKAAEALIAESAETALVLDNIRLTEKLILYQANLLTLANNFISFPHLYDPAGRAIFETGTLIMDGRRFNFSVKADDRKRHSDVAKTGNLFVLYVEVLPPDPQQRYEIAVPVTSGGKGNLCVGKRGVFQDVSGRELDARVVQIIENPISVCEALISPFQRLGRMLSGKIEAITTSAEKKLDTTAAGAVEQVKGPAPAAKAPQPSRGLLAGGLLMGGGVAIAALGSAVAYIGKTLSNVENYTTVLVVVGIAILAVILPTSIVAMMKLRKRDLSAILEGSGWAVNARMRLTGRLGRFFTQRPGFPKGARGVRRFWWVLPAIFIFAAAALATWYIGWR